MTMTKEEAAAKLNGCEYRQEAPRKFFAQMKEAGLAAVFGACDDLMCFYGAIDDEVGCYGGGYAALTSEGLLTRDCSDPDCPYFAALEEKATPVEAVFDDDGYTWTYRTEIPHVTFDVMDDGEKYCRGIVFALAEVPA